MSMKITLESSVEEVEEVVQDEYPLVDLEQFQKLYSSIVEKLIYANDYARKKHEILRRQNDVTFYFRGILNFIGPKPSPFRVKLYILKSGELGFGQIAEKRYHPILRKISKCASKKEIELLMDEYLEDSLRQRQSDDKQAKIKQQERERQQYLELKKKFENDEDN